MKMFSILCATLLLASSWALPLTDRYSYSPAVGYGSGNIYASDTGRITGIRVWENPSSAITGFQLRFRNNDTWGPVLGVAYKTPQELVLHTGETIVQVSGKFYPYNYVYQVFFVTSEGRFLLSGQGGGGYYYYYNNYVSSFNFYPKYAQTELVSLNGRFDGSGITSIGAYWGSIDSSDTDGTNEIE